MSWIDRLHQTIKLTSPEGNVFEGKYQRSTRRKSKKLGLRDAPLVKGTDIQDVSVNSSTETFVVNFDGDDHDLESKRFYDALDEIGVWQVVHPIHGNLELQPVFFGPADDPISSGNITAVDTEWMIPASKDILQSASELKSAAQQQKNAVNEKSAEQLNNNVDQNSAANIEATRKSSENGLASFKTTVKKITDGVGDISSQVNSIIRGIQDTVDETVIPVLSLAGQIQQLLELPTLVSQDFQTRFNAYNDLANSIFQNEPETTHPLRAKNNIAIQEAYLTGAMSSAILIGVTSEYQTRAQAIAAIVNLKDLFGNITNYLETTQDNLSAFDIDQQYFTQSEAYNDLYLMMSQAIAFLLLSSYDLKTEKIVKLENASATIDVAIREYAKTGQVTKENTDLFYDLLIATNQLIGDEIYLLPAGKEVVIYA